jgi:excisionase family DNA binding protein
MKLLTVKETSDILNVKGKTIYQWAEMNQIPHIKLNGCLRFDINDIQQWIQSCKKEPQSRYNPLTQARGPRKGGK